LEEERRVEERGLLVTYNEGLNKRDNLNEIVEEVTIQIGIRCR
jgi:hypothetical protein